MKYNINEIFSSYPHVFEISGGKIPKSLFYAILSPFANCQTFCFTYATALTIIDDEDMQEFLSDIYLHIEKTQCVIDVNAYKSKDILAKLNPFISNIISTPYKSTNKSNMIMHIIQFDRSKLIKD